MLCTLRSIPHAHLQPLSIGPEMDTRWRKSRWGKIEDMEASYRYLQTTLWWKKYVNYDGVESKKRCWRGNSMMNSINRFSKSSFHTSCERSLDLKGSGTAQKHTLGELWQAGLIKRYNFLNRPLQHWHTTSPSARPESDIQQNGFQHKSKFLILHGLPCNLFT